MRDIRIGFVVLALTCAAASPATSQNLVANGSFDHDVSSWTTDGDTTIALFFRGEAGSTLPGGSGPGCAEVRHSFWNGGADGVEQWADITAGAVLELKAAVYVPDSSDNVAQNASILLQYYTAESANVGSTWFYPASQNRGEWSAVAATTTAPGNATRVQVRLMVSNPALPNETRPGIAFFDDVWLAPQGVAAATQKLFVPVASSKQGAKGTFWKTTLWVANQTGVEVALSGAVLRPNEDNAARVAAPAPLATIPADGAANLTDVVGALGASVTGALYLEATAPGGGLPAALVRVASRNATPDPGGSGGYGQYVPATGPGLANRVVSPGAYQGADHRTNAGILNTSGETLAVGVMIVSPAGETLSTRSWTLKPYEPRLVALPDLGVTALEGGYVVLTRTSPVGSFRAYISVVDQHTGDSILIVAE